ncbi:unnamed protein product [Cunninghamella echinulata]
MTIYTQEKPNNCISSTKSYRFKFFNKSYSFSFFSKMNWISRRRRNNGKKFFSLLTCCTSDTDTFHEKTRRTDSYQDNSSNRLSNQNTAAPSQTLTYSTTSEISKEKIKRNSDVEPFVITKTNNDNNNNNNNNTVNIDINSNDNNNTQISQDPETNSIASSLSKN